MSSVLDFAPAGINICVESGDLPAARGVVSDMRAAGLPPDVQAYNTLVRARHPRTAPRVDLAGQRSDYRAGEGLLRT